MTSLGDQLVGATGAAVFQESKGKVNFLFGFLTVAFAAAIVRGAIAGPSGTTAVLVYAVLPIVLAGVLAGWYLTRRHPGRLEVGEDTIIHAHHGRPNTTTFRREDGELAVRSTGGRYPQRVLRSPGSEQAIPLQMFDERAVVQACRAAGWRFAGDP